jgi:hypothetical protein
MSGCRIRLSRRQCLLALAAVITFVTTLPAQQQEQRNIRSITRYRLKPDRAADFRSIVKEINAVLKKAGHNRAVTWWQSQSGPMELALVYYYGKWAELDSPPAAFKEAAAEIAPLQGRLMQCVNSAERIIDVILPEYSLPFAQGQEIPPMVSTMRLVVKRERLEEFLALQKAELLPVAQKSGLSSFLLARTRLGGPNTEFRRVIGMKSFADMDGTSPIVTAMGGQAAYQKYLTKVAPLVIEAEYNIYRRVPDLDFIPGK